MDTFETWDFPESNAQQQYATHAFLRYYGKLPPTVTKRILIEGEGYLKHGRGIDVACGSGTTLVEAALKSIPFDGVDINPISVMTSQLKVNPPQVEDLDREWFKFAADVEQAIEEAEGKSLEQLGLQPPEFRGRDEWFIPKVQKQLCLLLKCIERVEDENISKYLKVTFAGCIRKTSNASERAGRIFKQTDKKISMPWDAMKKRHGKLREGAKEYRASLKGQTSFQGEIILGDAKNTQCREGQHGMVFFHPPYFALYKYSSDVLRFELEWLNFSRKEIVKQEIRDGFKTTKVEDLQPFLDDIGSVLREGRRLVHPKGTMVVISNNSTLRKQSLPVIEGIIENARLADFRVARHCIRTVRFAQASYHKSADEEIRTPQDHIIFFEPC